MLCAKLSLYLPLELHWVNLSAVPLTILKRRHWAATASICYMHGPAYGAQKAGLDKFAHDMAVDLRPTGVRSVSIWMGPLITERSLIAAEVNKEQYEDFLATAETPQFIGHILHTIANDADGERLSGHTLIAAEITQEYGITDRDEKQPPSYREALGSPTPFHPAIIY
ncbi:MAG: NAD(P)-dependent dehydrogenase (short-subunit alcohol dehydrogenase family) [Halieaceae bacterium]|jgi:NAD(P)-dependent dehydrogenase (short-subunit alcohol dehydrogenase family)